MSSWSELNNQWQSEPMECVLVETTIASTPCAFHDNSRQLQEICFRGFLRLVLQIVLSVSYLLVSYFVMNFLRRIFAVCHSFRSMYQSGWMKGFERCFKVEDQGTWRRQNLHVAIFCDRLRRGYKILKPLWVPVLAIWGKKDPSRY